MRFLVLAGVYLACAPDAPTAIAEVRVASGRAPVPGSARPGARRRACAAPIAAGWKLSVTTAQKLTAGRASSARPFTR